MVLVVGDLMLDEYRSGAVARVSPEAPVPIVRVEDVRDALGGAANVARNVRSLGARAALVGLIGRDPEGDRFLAVLDREGIAPDGVVASGTRPTTHKQRVVADARQLVRVDREATDAPDEDEDAALRAAIEARLADAALVILEDYDKGVFAGGLASWLIRRARAAGVPVVADPKRDLARFRGADLVKPNLAEATACVGGAGTTESERAQLLEKLREVVGGGDVVVTRGSAGMSVLAAEEGLFDVPTRARSVYDVQGAGDTAIAALGLARLARASCVEACIVANVAASLAVEKFGTAAVAADELRRRLAAEDEPAVRSLVAKGERPAWSPVGG